MSVFSPANVARAIERIPRTDAATLRKWLDLGRREKLDPLVAACARELELRPVDLTADEAAKHADWSEGTRDMSLRSAIEYAFTQLSPRDYELSVIEIIARRPGVTYPELVSSHRKRDAALILGHCVYDRFGCLRHWAEGQRRMSDILFARDESGGPVRYGLTEEARAAFAALGMI
jgi:hypothetical protein